MSRLPSCPAFPHVTIPAVKAKTLKGTDFAYEGVFGDLPESFLTKFSSVVGNDLTCRQKSTYSNKSYSSDSSSRGKRSSPAASQQYNMKQKTGVNSNQGVFSWATNNPRGGGFPSGKTRGKGTGQKQN